MKVLPPEFYHLPTLQLAPALLGKILVRQLNGKRLSGRIVEVEAYLPQGDAASHAHRGPTARNKTMFGEPGLIYVYLIYGVHYCINVVSEPTGMGAAVLIRALEPLEGIDEMMQSRKITTKSLSKKCINLTNGPGKLCQALSLDRDLDGSSLQGPLLWLENSSMNLQQIQAEEIKTSKRIGITKSVHHEWRFYLGNNPYVSKSPLNEKNQMKCN